MSHWIRENRNILTYAVLGAAAFAGLYWFIKNEGPQMRRYLRIKQM